jgi:hypothetical protein
MGPGNTAAVEFVRAELSSVQGVQTRGTITWAVAVETAERVASSRLPPHERSVLARVVKLLVLARDSDSEPERRAAYTRARIELERLDTAGLVRLPAPARAVLDAGARGEITA